MHPSVDPALLAQLRAIRPLQQRQLLVLAGAADWCRAVAAALCADVDGGDVGGDECGYGEVVWLGAAVPAGIATVPMQRPEQLLGSEWRVIVLDAHAGLRPDTLAAAGGALCGGGRLLLLAPPLVQWSDFRDPDYGRLQPYGCEMKTANFWRRLRGLLDAPGVAVVEQGQPFLPMQAAELSDSSDADRLAEQCVAVAEIVRTAQGRAHRPLVLIADRGRGKSAALGLAAQQLLAQEPALKLIVTSARRDACTSLFRFAGPCAEQLCWLPPTEAIAARAEVLLVDEAAALPVAVLQQLLLSAPRVVFATTVHGYEGSGRGFELRFLPWIERAAPRWRRCRLQQPLRWQQGDWLERWLYRALLLDAAPLPPALEVDLAAVEINELLRDQLVVDEPLLRQLFGLLVQAHYRTAPDDLRDLLDGPNLRVWQARCGEAVVGVLVVAEEGNLSASLHAEIVRGERRPRGHLLPQALAFYSGLPDALALRCARVVRIAVAPELQRHGIGLALLQRAQATLQQQGFDWLGTSFAASAGGLAFWRRAGLRPLRIGFERETSSGQHAVQLGSALSAAGATLMTQAETGWQRQLPLALADYLCDLDAELVCALFMFDDAAGAAASDEQTQRDLDSYCHGARPLESVLPALQWWSRQLLTGGAVTDVLDHALLVGRLHQLRDWATLVRQLQLPGVEAAQRRLRQLLATLRG